MRRREFIKFLGGVAAWPLGAHAQQAEPVRRIGMLAGGADTDDPRSQPNITAFRQALQQLGWTDGRNVKIDYRWPAGDADKYRKYAAELVALAPDVILAIGTPSLASLLQATRTVPIVFVAVADPVGAGYVDSLSRPGGNATGFMLFDYGLSTKWLELLKQIAPGVTRAAVLRDPAITSGIGQFAVIQYVAPSLGVDVSPIDVRDASAIRARPRGLRAFRQWRSDRDREPVIAHSSRTDHHACGPAQAALGLLPTPLRHRRRPNLLWARCGRPSAARGRLCRPHSQR